MKPAVRAKRRQGRPGPARFEHWRHWNLENFVCKNQFTKPDLAGTKPDPVGRTPYLPYPLITFPYHPHLHPPISHFLFHISTIP